MVNKFKKLWPKNLTVVNHGMFSQPFIESTGVSLKRDTDSARRDKQVVN